MKKYRERMKVLNLYAGIGGNRKLWKDVEVTAIENNKDIAKIYQDFFPNDKVIVKDAHKYLLEHYKEFDFIWSSPPCPTHSDMKRMNVDMGNSKPVYPDMKLYEEIIFLKQFSKCKWVVENVKSYYKPLRKPQISGRHYFWANFNITNKRIETFNIRANKREYKKKYGFNIDKRKLLRNCVHPKLSIHIFNCAF